MCIELKNIGLTLSDKVIFKSMNSVFRVGFNLIYGSSGSGKTSLLKIINMLLSPTYGKILYKGMEIKDRETSYWRSVCMLTKQITVFSEGSVMDNIRLPFEFKINREKKLNEPMLYTLFEEFNLSKDMLNKDVKKLSGGESQRVAIIRSILLNPDVFLFDEPTSALDYNMQEKMFHKIKSLSIEKVCIVASHSKDALKYADRVFIIEEGRLKSV